MSTRLRQCKLSHSVTIPRKLTNTAHIVVKLREPLLRVLSETVCGVGPCGNWISEVMKALASRLAALVSPVDFIALYGELGAGKTAFAQTLLTALGVAEAATSGQPMGERTAIQREPARSIIAIFSGSVLATRKTMASTRCAPEASWSRNGPRRSAPFCPPTGLRCGSEAKGATRSVSLTGFGAWEKKLGALPRDRCLSGQERLGRCALHRSSGRRFGAPVLPACARVRNPNADGLAAATRRAADPDGRPAR